MCVCLYIYICMYICMKKILPAQQHDDFCLYAASEQHLYICMHIYI